MVSKGIGLRFRNYIAEMVLRLYLELRSSDKLSAYAPVLSYKLKTAARYSSTKDLYLLRLEEALKSHSTEFYIKFDGEYLDEFVSELGFETD